MCDLVSTTDLAGMAKFLCGKPFGCRYETVFLFICDRNASLIKAFNTHDGLNKHSLSLLSSNEDDESM